MAFHKAPRRKRFLPFYKPALGKDEEKEIIAVLRSGWLGRGPRTEEFEDAFRRYVRSRHAVGVNSCTAGLHLSLAALGIGEGDEVITTPMTFPATANAIIHQGATPVFADVEKDTFNIDPERIEPTITKRTKAVIVVHFAGHPCEMDKITAIARRRGLFVIEDASHALGSSYRGKKIGSMGDLACFSFYATKNITTGEGGMVTTDDGQLAAKIRLLSRHGISMDAGERKTKRGYEHWEAILPGYKYNMCDLQAALGLAQLRKIKKLLALRKKYFRIYNEMLSTVPEIITPVTREGVEHSHHLYAVITRSEDLSIGRDGILNILFRRKIGAGVHYRALHLQRLYRDRYKFSRNAFPVAEYISDRTLSLPLYPAMTEDDVSCVAENIKEIIGIHRKRGSRPGTHENRAS
ncbi:MAG: DegT/DnrJ/EryC1/StrS aminotransferase family protein [Candidatus Omnitrophota bacterium]